MKANELRIGNYYICSDDNEIVSIDDAYSLYLIQENKNALPIPLTEEWLLKFGFVKQKNYSKVRNGISKFNWTKDNIHYFSIEKHHFGEYDEGQTFYPTFRFSNIFIPLSTVHQLQNLYFTLSGEDLILNEDK